ncbi:unnamed protein product [Rotaria sp. Silwood2]|nr:unnamed protein product [Rotaria sp. Silwood2]CAF3166084.1 unnamed protein product [Rotaria sp. Silwood2]CAF3233258.1 unnamed protein product [Rotaria sp. Silwood2]CAF3308696.1 unnamed protein product [Rotaria sp. Silwood2]CAF4243788.1 unnamed protein product [Rotaria sp. Silwood2]
MALRILSLYLLIFMVFVSSVESSPLLDSFLMENYPSLNLAHTSSPIIHRSNFISLICQRQEQYPIRLTRKLCSNYFQPYKLQEEDEEQQQRNKRVGWTISV